MGFLERLKASQSAGIADWHNLVSITQLEEVDKASFDKPIILFKHSTTCGISAGAKQRLEMNWSEVQGAPVLYYLDLLSYRAISNAIAERYQIRHESPQIVVVKNGRAIYNASHHRINTKDLNATLVQ